MKFINTSIELSSRNDTRRTSTCACRWCSNKNKWANSRTSGWAYCCHKCSVDIQTISICYAERLSNMCPCIQWQCGWSSGRHSHIRSIDHINTEKPTWRQATHSQTCTRTYTMFKCLGLWHSVLEGLPLARDAAWISVPPLTMLVGLTHMLIENTLYWVSNADIPLTVMYASEEENLQAWLIRPMVELPPAFVAVRKLGPESTSGAGESNGK